MNPPVCGFKTARLARRGGERGLLELVQLDTSASSGNCAVLNENAGSIAAATRRQHTLRQRSDPPSWRQGAGKIGPVALASAVAATH